MRSDLFTMLNLIYFSQFTNVNLKMFTFVKQKLSYGFRTIIQSI